MTGALKVVPLLLRGRMRAGTGVIDLLSVIAFTVSSWLLLAVLGGVNAFAVRQVTPPAPFVAAMGADAAVGVAELVLWTVLAACAGVLVVVPIFVLSGAAARMGALGRDQRLAILRLLGASQGEVTVLTAVETMLTALLGIVLGVAGYLLSLPMWTMVTFQATPMTAAEMLLPAWAIVAVVGLLLALAGLGAVSALSRLRISPLGVARRQSRPALTWWRLVALPVSILAWQVVAPMLQVRIELAIAVSIVLVALGLFMGLINLLGPWVLQLLGKMLVGSERAAVLIAGRRLLAEPKAAWRSVSGLAFIGFTGGAVVSIPAIGAGSGDPLLRIFSDDLRTGTLLTLGIAFLVAAASTLLNQASAVLDRRQEFRQLGNLGAPRVLHDQARRVEVVAPAVLSAAGSGGLAVFFFGLVPGAAFATNPIGLLAFAGAVLGGIALVWLAGEACRPLVRQALADR